MPVRVRELPRPACDTDDVDASWQIWSSEAAASLTRAYHSAGGPTLAGPGSFVGGNFIMCTKMLGAHFRTVFIAPIMRMNLMLPTLGSSLTHHHLPRYCGSAVGSSQCTLFLKAFGQRGLRTPT